MRHFIKLFLLAALTLPGVTLAQGLQTSTKQTAAERSGNAAAQTDVSALQLLQAEWAKSPVGTEDVDRIPRATTSSKTTLPLTIAATRQPANAPAPRKVDANAPAVFVQTDVDVTICDDTQQNSNLPVYSYRFNREATASQWIYPNSLLNDIPVGSPIKSITFYSASTTIPSAVSSATVQVKVGEVNAATIADIDAMNGNRSNTAMKTVYTGKLKPTGNTMTITFSTPYVYQGGNLLFDIYVTEGGSSAECLWYGVQADPGSGARNYISTLFLWEVNNFEQQSFLPKAKIVFETWAPTEEIDFGTVIVGGNKQISAYINDPGNGATVNLSTDGVFGVSPETLPSGGKYDFTLSFTPDAATNYTGKLQLSLNGLTANVDMKGIGSIPGTPATRDSSFFAGIEYTWPINIEESFRPEDNKATLDQIATDPDQIIGLLHEVYVNKSVPGNYTRGFTEGGLPETAYPDVAYTGVGTIEHSGSDYTTGYTYADGYGWNVPGDIVTGSASNGYIRYAHMDSTQYKPDVEGLTLLLVEMRDDYTTAKMQEYVTAQNPSTDYEKLKAYISYAIKSVRVITQAMRTGEGFDAGTLFKIDCDKMNKFYLIAKGQLRYPFNSNHVFSDDKHYYPNFTFCRLPLYAYSYYSDIYYLGNSSYGHGGFLDYNCGDVFGAHMFEQFSPYNLTEANSVTDIYADLVGMNSFSVPHDCVAVPAATPAATPAGGHFFRMYGDDVDINKCQDVRDMMFFIPDYRMMYFADHEVTVRRPVIVADGKAEGTTAGTNKYVPVYSTKYNRQGSYVQLIYPKSMLDTLTKVGKPIRSITFHPGSTTAFGSGQVTVKMGETGLSSFGENPSRLSLTNYVEATITPTLGDNKLTITFANPYSYQGGNLLIDLEVTTPGTAGEMVWNGIVTTDNQAIDYNIDDAGPNNKVWPVQFLPAITFTYEEQATESRDTSPSTTYTAQAVKYQNYHPDHRPKMALYIIKQDPVTCPENCQTDNYYKLTLTWDSNMDEFLPGKKQKYYLLQLVQDEFGKDKYIPVYKTNEEGKYWNAKTSEWQDDTIGAERVVLTNIAPSNDKKTYTEVYVKRQSGSQQVTYAIQGCDMDDFLTLQISNQQSYIVPGTDPAEMMLLGDATYYSRYNAQTQRNCYSNKMVVKSNPRMIRKEYVQEGTQLTLKRVSTAGEEVVATAVVQSMPTTDDSGKMLVTLFNQSDKTEYPTGKSDNPVVNYAGYHANSGKDLEIDDEGRTTWKHSFFEYTEGEFSYINLGELEIYDNFVVDVSENNHPRQYIYTMEFTTAAEIVGKEGANQAYSNSHRVPVYQTDSRVNPPLTKQQVLDDTDMKDDYKACDIAFEEQVELSSKTEIYRYDAYRWASENSDEFYTFNKVKGYDAEEKITPNGIAGNQGQSYSVSMNDVNSQYNYTGSVNVSQENQQAWAKFVDKYPTSDAAEASAYTYAPVVELFSTGVDMTGTAMRADYNTYGGPQQKTAVGKLDIEFVTDGGNIEASEFEWEMNGQTYCYYNMPIKFKVFGVPTDYEVYKVRAWRQVDTSLLGERPEDVEHNVPDRSERIRPNYLFEELTYGQEFDRDGGVSAAGLQSYEFGNRPRAYRPDGTPIETWATFGALKLSDKAEMKVNVVARVYFTKKNIDAAMNGTGAPRRVLTADNLSADGKYYVIEKSIEKTLNADNIITAVGTVRAGCEPVSVSYVNTVGQMSSTPWQGVNIVVTRYSDGSTTTRKVIR